MSRFYCVPEVASLLRVKPSSVYSWIKSGKLKCVKIGRLIRVTEEQVSSLLNPSEATASNANTSVTRSRA